MWVHHYAEDFKRIFLTPRYLYNLFVGELVLAWLACYEYKRPLASGVKSTIFLLQVEDRFRPKKTTVPWRGRRIKCKNVSTPPPMKDWVTILCPLSSGKTLQSFFPWWLGKPGFTSTWSSVAVLEVTQDTAFRTIFFGSSTPPRWSTPRCLMCGSASTTASGFGNLKKAKARKCGVF